MTAEGNTATCQHHWLISNSEGATSPGVCRYCGAVRTFRNELGAPGDFVLSQTQKARKKGASLPEMRGQYHLTHLKGPANHGLSREELASRVETIRTLLAERNSLHEIADRMALEPEEVRELLARFPDGVGAEDV